MKQELYRKLVAHIVENQEKFYRLAFSYLKNQEDALDVVQSAICKALEHYGELKSEAALKTWFYRIVLNESIILYNKKKREILTQDSEWMEQSYEEKGFDIHDDIGGDCPGSGNEREYGEGETVQRTESIKDC